MGKLPNFRYIGKLFLAGILLVISNSRFRSFLVRILIEKILIQCRLKSFRKQILYKRNKTKEKLEGIQYCKFTFSFLSRGVIL